MYAVLSMFDYNWKQQRNNKTTKTSQPLNKNKNLKQWKQANKKTKTKNKKNKKTKKQDSWQKSLDKKIIYFLQLLTDIAFNPRPGSCCNAQRYGNDESG